MCTYLTSKSWETRIAAGQAVEAIARNVKKWQPLGSNGSRQPSPSSGAGPGESEAAATSKESSPTSDKDSDLLTFETFDLNQVMCTVHKQVVTLIGVHEMRGRVHPN